MDKAFDPKEYYWKSDIDYRLHPELYRVGKGEQGVLLCEPYKSEILPFWAFKTPEIATQSSEKIFSLFHVYLENNDFVGADMARKFLQMGFTRARRYTNYKGGKKYEEAKQLAVGTGDPIKARCAHIFYKKWKEAESCSAYENQKKVWKAKYG